MQIRTTTLNWDAIQRHLRPGMMIPSHNRSGRNADQSFEIDRIDVDKFFVWPFAATRSSNQRSRPVRRKDIETVLEYWNAYHSAAGCNIPTFNNSYCLAVIAYVLRELERSSSSANGRVRQTSTVGHQEREHD